MHTIPAKNCNGCSACYNICPHKVVEMVSDNEGFVYPKISEDKCVNCGLCEAVCPEIHPPRVADKYYGSFIFRSEKKEVMETCTSGGFIDELNAHIIDKLKGYCVGVAYDEHFLPFHMMTDNCEEVKLFRNSKYAQSRTGNIFKSIRTKLNEGNIVLFTGTPCQVAGLKSYLQKEYDNLYTVDLVCRSVPSPLLWEKYLAWQEEQYGSKIKSVMCRKKTYGYHSGTLEIQFQNGKVYLGSNRVDYYMKSFHHDVCSRSSCYNCSYKTEHRCSDFTVFDCWNSHLVADGLAADDDKGFSNVVVHSAKGIKIMDEISKGNVIYPADPVKMFAYTGGMESHSIVRTSERDTFYQDLSRNSFINTAKKYVQVTLLDRLIEKAKPARYMLQKLLR